MSTQFARILWDHTIALAELVSMGMEKSVWVPKIVLIFYSIPNQLEQKQTKRANLQNKITFCP